ncbi:MAG: hypothetical protein ACRER5_05420, partial [Pseudomonas sp.]
MARHARGVVGEAEGWIRVVLAGPDEEERSHCPSRPRDGPRTKFGRALLQVILVSKSNKVSF